jgi:hypothetical protein
MDPHAYAKSSGVYGAMTYPLVDDWELIQSELSRAPKGSYVLYRSTEAKHQQQDANDEDTVNCFEVALYSLSDHATRDLTIETGRHCVSVTKGQTKVWPIDWYTFV